MQMMPLLQSAGLPPELWAEIIEYSPFPAALVEKMKQFAQKAGQQPPDPATEQMKQLAILKAQADIKEKEAEAEREKANAFENMMQGFKAQAEAQIAPQEAAARIAQAWGNAQPAQPAQPMQGNPGGPVPPV